TTGEAVLSRPSAPVRNAKGGGKGREGKKDGKTRRVNLQTDLPQPCSAAEYTEVSWKGQRQCRSPSEAGFPRRRKSDRVVSPYRRCRSSRRTGEASGSSAVACSSTRMPEAARSRVDSARIRENSRWRTLA